MTNALKYSPDPQPVGLCLSREDESAHITLRDQGIGIPPDDLERIFERFQRGSNRVTDDIAGIGLGLFICRGIVDPLVAADSRTARPRSLIDKAACKEKYACGRHAR